jgi:formylglycine-generating enzyme required for sulfatase activity
MEFVFIPGGCFQMGSPPDEVDRRVDEGPVHEVCVDSFYLGKYEVTNAQYGTYDPSHRIKNSEDGKSTSRNRGAILFGDKQPVVEVSWLEANSFASWLGGKNGKLLRLPTEAEWEYAARATTKSSRYWGNNADSACTNANIMNDIYTTNWPFPGFHCEDGFYGTSPVGNFSPNKFGLYDMIGNAWEWTNDWYDKGYYSVSPKNNPMGPSTGNGYVLRGGSWGSAPFLARAATRMKQPPHKRDPHHGFRLLMQVNE